MNINCLRSCMLVAILFGCCCDAAMAQVVRIAPIVKLIPTPDADSRHPGTVPPPSEPLVEMGSTFYVELWATNSGEPLDGLACVYVDLHYDHTDLVDAVPPEQDSPLFPINAVPIVFDDASGMVGDTGGCQPAPPIEFLGVDEWVFVERIEMVAVHIGGPVTLSVQDADNIFAFTAIIGDAQGVDPADIDFQMRAVTIVCTVDDDCIDEDPCTIDECAGGECQHLPVDCSEFGDQCTPASCDPNGAEGNCDILTPVEDGTECDDGDACTEYDICTMPVNCRVFSCSICAGTPIECGDDNVCNGVETCDPVDGCQPGTPLECDDGLYCNGQELCDSASGCELGILIDCDDGIDCTDDACNEDADACEHVAGDDLCDNGQFCDGEEICNPTQGCESGEPIVCDDAVACTEDQCNEDADGCEHHPIVDYCDNGEFCDGVETCDPALDCQPGTDPCTDPDFPVCDEDLDACRGDECVNDADCDDGDACNGIETCDVGQCVSGTPLDCDDGDQCTIDGCDPGAGCTHEALDCDDDNDCTDDSCDPGGGCVHAPNAEPCDDGLACTEEDMCSGGECGGKAVECSGEGDQCNATSCDPEGPDGNCDIITPLPDGAPCGEHAVCEEGTCVEVLHLDIMPRACPNGIRRGTDAAIWMALLGTDDFDITQVRVSNIELRRADGVGDSLAPRNLRFMDESTPVEGELCDCRAAERDGIADLRMKFKTAAMVEAFELDEQPSGADILLRITGTLNDGTPFVGSDCILVLR